MMSWVGYLYIVLSLMLQLSVIANRDEFGVFEPKARDSKRVRSSKPKFGPRSKKPNIVLILTDDQDKVFGSMEHMHKTLRIMRDGGAEFTNAFVTTPMCCPSRSSILTGMYVHSHNVHTNNDNCSSIRWQQTHETKNFATYLSNVGYRTGYFGKYLNEYNGTYIPPGWREWMGLIRNSRFYNYSINFNGKKIQHRDNYYRDYLTDLIANDSVTFLRQSKEYFSNRPVMMVLSVPAPHGPEDSAPQYQHMFQNNRDHRTPAWDYAPNPDKQWLLQITNRMQPIHQRFTDMLQQKRLQTLQSVDDMVEKVYKELKNLGELDNTYIMYTSDHGYHLGQYGLLKGKAMPYETDIRVPLYIRGPNIKPNTKVSEIVANIDYAPTFLAMGGIPAPPHMDGVSMLSALPHIPTSNSKATGIVNDERVPRDTILIERGKVTKKKMQEVRRMEKKIILEKMRLSNTSHTIPDTVLETVLSRKEIRLARICARKEMSPPCTPDQKYVCIQQNNGALKLVKCSTLRATANPPQGDRECVCQRIGILPQKLPVLRGEPLVRPTDNSVRFKRDLAPNGNVDAERLINNHLNLGKAAKCRVLPNNTVKCVDAIYQNEEEWRSHKEHIDELIELYKGQLERLKDIRKHLKEMRPVKVIAPDHSSPSSDYHIGYRDAGGVCHCNRGYQADRTKKQRQRFLSRLSSNYTKLGVNSFDEFSSDIFSRHGTIKERKQRLKTLKKQLLRLDKKQKLCKKTAKNCFSTNWDILMKYIRHNRKRFKHPNCWRMGYECNVMDNAHWQTPPYWTDGPFCFCSNSNNNTYWCLRTINSTHNFIYCEFITKFISYYDLMKDPYQLQNAVHDLNYGVLQQLHERLVTIRRCHGARQCNLLNTSKDKIKRKKGWRQRQSSSRRQSLKKKRRQWRGRSPGRRG